MSASIDVAELVQRRATDRRADERALLSRRLSVVQEMLGTLDTLTIAGRHHVMDKVIAFIEGHVQQVAPGASQGNRATLLELVTQLRRESDRLSPDSERFAQRSESLINLLVAIG